MFQKHGSSTSGGKKDAPLRKSDRRKLRDRVLDAIFIEANGNGITTDGNKAAWIRRACKLIDDAFVAPKGGDVLVRKLKLPSGEHATLYLRTPTPSLSGSDQSLNESKDSGEHDQLLESYPVSWPYHESTQPILLEYEDADRKVHLVPLLSLLAALPPPSLTQIAKNNTTEEVVSETETARSEPSMKYRIPNIAIHPQVSHYLCRGADLMRSGIRSFPPPWELRQSKGVVTISIIGNPMPMAVGFVEKSLMREYCYPKNGKSGGGGGVGGGMNASQLVGPGMKGVGVLIVNCYGDDLWKSSLPSNVNLGGVKAMASSGNSAALNANDINPLGGNSYDDGHYGNVGFVDGTDVGAIQPIGEEVDSSDEGEDDNFDSKENDENDATEGINQIMISDEANMTEAEVSEKLTEDARTELDGNISGEDASNNQTEGEPSRSLPDHDDILTRAFYTSLLHLLSTKTPLPLLVSTFYAKNLLAMVPPNGPKLDMKQTKYKKIGPFLLEMESDGVIKLGASKDGKDRCAFLVGINKQHPDLVEFKRKWKKEIEANGGDVTMFGAGPSGALTKKKLAVVDLFIVPRHISDGLQLDKDAVMAAGAKSEQRRGTGYLTKAESRALVENYIESEELVDPNRKGCVVVNGPLCDALYRASKKDRKQQAQQPQSSIESDSGYPTSVKRKDLIDKWMEKMDKGYALVEMPGSQILHMARGEPIPVAIEVEFRQGNRKKFLTRLRGMEEYGIDAESLSNDVSHRFACSSTIETNPEGRPALKKGRAELVFQGHLSEELTASLTGDEKLSTHGGAKGSEYNLPKNVVKVALRKGVPARKKR